MKERSEEVSVKMYRQSVHNEMNRAATVNLQSETIPKKW